MLPNGGDGGGGGGGGGVSGKGGGGVAGISGSVSKSSKLVTSEIGEYGGLSSSEDTSDRVGEAGVKYTGEAEGRLRVDGLSSQVEGMYTGLSG